MDPFEIAGNAAGTALRFAPAHDGKLLMTVWSLDRSGLGGHESVTLQTSWLRPLAAWLAGEAQQGIVGHGEYGMPYGRWLTIGGDETAVACSTHTEARLECRSPYGSARVTIGPRGRQVRGYTTVLSPRARREMAAWLRRADSKHWTRTAV